MCGPVFARKGGVIIRHCGNHRENASFPASLVSLPLNHLSVKLVSLSSTFFFFSQTRVLPGTLPCELVQLSDIVWNVACERRAGLHTLSPKALIYLWGSTVLGWCQVLALSPFSIQWMISWTGTRTRHIITTIVNWFMSFLELEINKSNIWNSLVQVRKVSNSGGAATTAVTSASLLR